MKINRDRSDYLASYGTSKQLPVSTLAEIAFSGRSNVGKSSLINKLLNRKALARVSSVPGKTITANFYGVGKTENKIGYIFHIVDLPGYGYAKVSKSEKQRWSELIQFYFSSERDINLVVQLLDFRHPPSKDDLTMINFLIDYEIPFVIALTKSDKLKKAEKIVRRAALQKELPCAEQLTLIELSSVTGDGFPELWGIIEEVFFK